MGRDFEGYIKLIVRTDFDLIEAVVNYVNPVDNRQQMYGNENVAKKMLVCYPKVFLEET